MGHSPAHALAYIQSAHAPFTCIQMCVCVFYSLCVRTVCVYLVWRRQPPCEAWGLGTYASISRARGMQLKARKIKNFRNYIISYIMHEAVVCVGCESLKPPIEEISLLSKRKKFLLYGEIFKVRHA